MGELTRLYTFDGVIESGEYNPEIDQIYNEINGSLDAANIADNAILNDKIPDSEIEVQKIAGLTGTGAIDLSKIPGSEGTATLKPIDPSVTSDNITHAETTHYKLVDIPLSIITNNGIDNPLEINVDYCNWAYAKDTDGVYDTGQVNVDIPDGAVLKKLTLVGLTQETDGTIRARLYKRANDNVATLITTITLTDGDTSGFSPLTETIDMSTYAYHVEVSAKASDTYATNGTLFFLLYEYTSLNMKTT